MRSRLFLRRRACASTPPRGGPPPTPGPSDPSSEAADADDAPTAWLLPPDERDEMPADTADEVSVERGVGLLVVGLLCLLFGLLGFEL